MIDKNFLLTERTCADTLGFYPKADPDILHAALSREDGAEDQALLYINIRVVTRSDDGQSATKDLFVEYRFDPDARRDTPRGWRPDQMDVMLAAYPESERLSREIDMWTFLLMRAYELPGVARLITQHEEFLAECLLRHEPRTRFYGVKIERTAHGGYRTYDRHGVMTIAVMFGTA